MSKLKLIKRTEPPEVKEIVYIGIDLSLTGTGLVALDGDTKEILKQMLVSTVPKDFDCTEARLGYIKGQIVGFIREYINRAPIKVAIEGVSFGSRGSRLAQISGLHYVVRCFLHRKKGQLEYEVVPPTVLKKFVADNGQAKKELMLLKAFKRWGVEFTDNNICDAYCLTRYAKENM